MTKQEEIREGIKPCIWCGFSDSYPGKRGKRKCGACGRTLTSRDIKRGKIVKVLCGMEWDALYSWSVAGWPFGKKFHDKGIPYLTGFAEKILDQTIGYVAVAPLIEGR